MVIRKHATLRWIAFVLAMLSVAVVTLAAATHDDTDGPSCLLCKVGRAPVELAETADALIVPVAVDTVPGELEPSELSAPDHGLRPRAPPV